MTDLDIKPGETWLRRDGGKARIYATDGGAPCPIHGAVECDGEWWFETWTKKGTVFESNGHSRDLIRRIDWRDDLAPIWAVLRPEYRWLAMDADGDDPWMAFTTGPRDKPETADAIWLGTGVRLRAVKMPTPYCDWTETCTERPEGM